MQYFAYTHAGKIRERNEDAVFVLNEGVTIAIVADGMGGHNAGNVAANAATKGLYDYLKKKKKSISEADMKNGFLAANKSVFRMSYLKDEYFHMGTTMTAAVVNKNNVIVGHVGDSRAYVFSNELKLITHDHSLVQEMLERGVIDEETARFHPQKNIITRAIGTKRNVDVDVYSFHINTGDMMLLCSDGLTRYLSEKEIENILCRNGSIEEKVKVMGNLALHRGGADNISIVGLLNID
ncbi:MAG: Stp1/IreP family PP2C-type Ser/Thr phosphatase [Eubacteriales bacterium]